MGAPLYLTPPSPPRQEPRDFTSGLLCTRSQITEAGLRRSEEGASVQ
ncbi:hypothetical protein ACWDR1_22845 [Streptosporangium sandarakinum]